MARAGRRQGRCDLSSLGGGGVGEARAEPWVARVDAEAAPGLGVGERQLAEVGQLLLARVAQVDERYVLLAVQGQRLMQSASDIFLGWATGLRGNDLYVRQLRDAKIKPLVETFDRHMLVLYGKACGWALARAHGRASHPWLISGYLGTSDAFDEAMGSFAVAYADQAERDHAALKAAVSAGRIQVHIEEDR